MNQKCVIIYKRKRFGKEGSFTRRGSFTFIFKDVHPVIETDIPGYVHHRLYDCPLIVLIEIAYIDCIAGYGSGMWKRAGIT